MFCKLIINDAVKWIFILLWIAGNLSLFGYTFWKYLDWSQYYYLRTILGIPIAVSRASAAALNLNCCLILLPVCRNLVSFLRCSVPFGKTYIWRHLDKNLSFHKLCGYTICFWAVVHFAGHAFNFERFIHAMAMPDDPIDLRHVLSDLPMTPNGTWLNPVRTNETNPMYELMTVLPGFTGVIAVLCLMLMVSSSTEFVRRNLFEVFWYTHHLFIVFFIVIIAHGFGGVIRGQTNLKEHNYTFCQNKSTLWNKIEECPAPQFQPKTPETWMWVICPIFIYFVESLIRFSRRFQKVEIVQVICHPSQVMELQMKKRGFKIINPGQYIFINCPSISKLQWHPFTLTSAPDDIYFSVHMRKSGNWTEQMAKSFHCNDSQETSASPTINQLPSLSVDGPFGTSSEDVFEYKVAMLVAAGIGVTPFASVLKHIWYKHSYPGETTKLRKVYFFWVCPDSRSFEWFVEILHSLETKMEAEGNNHFIEISMYWTRGWNDNQIFHIIGTAGHSRDAVTNLKHKTNFGRPNWDKIFHGLKEKHPKEKIGVFFCGPKEMSKQLQLLSDVHSEFEGTCFVYNKENF